MSRSVRATVSGAHGGVGRIMAVLLTVASAKRRIVRKAAPASRAAVLRRRAAALGVAGVAALGLAGRSAEAELLLNASLLIQRPVLPHAPQGPDLLAALADSTPLPITTADGWRKRHVVVAADRVLHDRLLWRQMRFSDWDTVPAPYRVRAIHLMLRVYRYAFSEPAWRRMDAADWDLVPQPVRAMAYVRMIRYWTARERVGAGFGLDSRSLVRTIAAIVMTESSFEHRAVNENAWGNRDLGLAQCSDHCRSELQRMFEDGDTSWRPAEADYFNPLVATRVATVWFDRELTRADGDIETAIRAYHRGIDRASDARGDAYLTAVLARRSRYFAGRSPSPTWRLLQNDTASIFTNLVPASAGVPSARVVVPQ